MGAAGRAKDPDPTQGGIGSGKAHLWAEGRVWGGWALVSCLTPYTQLLPHLHTKGAQEGVGIGWDIGGVRLGIYCPGIPQ